MEPDQQGGIPRLERGQHLPVLIRNAVPIALLVEIDGPVGIGGIPQLVQQAHQPGHVAGIEDREVEAAIRQGHGEDVLHCRGLIDRLQQLPQVIEIRVREPGNGPFDGLRLQK